MKDLRDRKWIDRDTRTVYIKFALYNRHLRLFATTNLIFRYAPSGGLTLPVEATVNTVNMEPYNSARGIVLLVLELILTMLVGHDMGNLIWSLCFSYSRGSVFGWLCDMWNYLDLINTLLLTYSLILRLRFVGWIYSVPLLLPTRGYPSVLDELAQFQMSQTNINAINGLICFLVFFKYYNFQDRLKVLLIVLMCC